MDDAFLRFDPVRLDKGDGRKPVIEIQFNDVQVWGLLLEIDSGDLPAARHFLSGDELERIDRLVSARHRQQFIAAHAALRIVLSRYCGRYPEELAFHKTSTGKPFLKDETAIRFNLTHSHGRALIAVARDREVGIDLEKIRPEVDIAHLAERFLSREDRVFIESDDPARQHERFLQTWVAREAVFKAEGKGMTFPLHHDHLELSGRGKEARLIRGRDGCEGMDMPIRFLPLEPGWVGAVAAQGTNLAVSFRSFEEP